jgi:para-nitrobenzyl esterase
MGLTISKLLRTLALRGSPMDNRPTSNLHLPPFFTLLMSLLGFLILSMRCTPANAASSGAASTSVIKIQNGSLQGQTVGNENQYLGIPFAAPPVGQFRWRPTQPFGHWHGVFQATTFGNECPQLNALGSFTGDENCLFLNVYTPVSATAAHGSKGVPVMVWIHGGGLTSGDASTYDPTPLVSQGVIVVTFNYRLGLLGFFAQTSLDAHTRLKANYGFMDQQFALKWVIRNIAAFGGNPNLVTIFGESAGGQSVYANLASPLGKRLFQHAIAESGSYGDYADYQEAIIPIAQAETTGSLFE